MLSDLAKKKAAKKKAAKARQWHRKGHEENGDAVTESQVAEEKIEEANGRETTGDAEVDLLTKELEDFEMKKTAARAVTSILASHRNNTSVYTINLSLTFHGQELLSDTKLELNSGRRYGLIGLNGIGEALGGQVEEVSFLVCLLLTMCLALTKQELYPMSGGPDMLETWGL